MTDQDSAVAPPTEAQKLAAFSGHASGVNRFVASLGPTGLRLAFLEEDLHGVPHFRAAVTMSPYDGVRLYQMLEVMLADLKADLDLASQNG